MPFFSSANNFLAPQNLPFCTSHHSSPPATLASTSTPARWDAVLFVSFLIKSIRSFRFTEFCVFTVLLVECGQSKAGACPSTSATLPHLRERAAQTRGALLLMGKRTQWRTFPSFSFGLLALPRDRGGGHLVVGEADEACLREGGPVVVTGRM